MEYCKFSRLRFIPNIYLVLLCFSSSVRHGVVRHGVVRHGIVMHGIVMHGIVRYGIVRHGIVRHGIGRPTILIMSAVCKLLTGAARSKFQLLSFV